MRISVTEAKAQLTDLVRRAEAGAEVILTRHGQPAVKLVPLRQPPQTAEQRRALLDEIIQEAARDKVPGPGGAELQDRLHDDAGRPV